MNQKDKKIHVFMRYARGWTVFACGFSIGKSMLPADGVSSSESDMSETTCKSCLEKVRQAAQYRDGGDDIAARADARLEEMKLEVQAERDDKNRRMDKERQARS